MNLEYQVLLKVAEYESFSLAARSLEMTPSAISKLVARLEDRLSVRLFDRTTRRVSLTPDGETFSARVREILESLHQAEAELSRSARAPRGKLRVNCVAGFAFHHLSTALPRFLAACPEVDLELSVSDRIVDLLDESADIAIRSGEIQDTQLIARQISTFTRRFYASPAYVAGSAPLLRLSDLAQHRCIVQGTGSAKVWRLTSGTKADIPIGSALKVDNAEATLQLAIAGAGVARIANMLAADAVCRGLLVEVLTQEPTAKPTALWAVYPQGRHRTPRVRAFLSFLIEEFRDREWA